MKIFILGCLLFCFTSVHANADIESANIYADQLIKKFDAQLAEGKNPSKLSALYKKIQATREFIENNGHEPKPYKPENLLKFHSSDKLYDFKLNIETQIIKNDIKFLTEQALSTQSIYPSATRSGNITGNKFPENVWSLTFDDGPHEYRTLDVLDNLIDHGQQASFFALASKTRRYPEVTQTIINNGMELALHSYSHKNLAKASPETISYEIYTAKAEMERDFNRPLNLFRLPYGSGMNKPSLRKQIADYNLIHVFWNVDTLDWKDKNPESIFQRTIMQMRQSPNNSGIILFHDIHEQTVVASKMVMEYLNNQQLKVCTVGEVVNYINNKFQSCLEPKNEASQ